VRLVGFTGVAALLLFAGLAWYLAPLQPGVLALQLAFTPRAFAQVVHAWPPEHLLRYRSHLPVDCLLLASYGTFGYLLASRSGLFVQYSRPFRIAATWALPLAAICDATENALHWWLTTMPRFGVVWPYFVSATPSTLKWALLFGFAVAVIHALTRPGSERLQRSSDKAP
jgi:hypothetical protein